MFDQVEPHFQQHEACRSTGMAMQWTEGVQLVNDRGWITRPDKQTCEALLALAAKDRGFRRGDWNSLHDETACRSESLQIDLFTYTPRHSWPQAAIEWLSASDPASARKRLCPYPMLKMGELAAPVLLRASSASSSAIWPMRR